MGWRAPMDQRKRSCDAALGAGRGTSIWPYCAALFSLVGCGGAAPAAARPTDSAGTNMRADGGAGAAPDGGSEAGADAAALIASRPYTIHVPSGYDPARPTPLLVMLHGYSAGGQLEENSLFHLTQASDTYGFLYALPDGTVDSAGNRFWNATDACCNFYGSQVDDVAYLNAVIDDITSKYQVDLRQVFVGGHSNGAMMAQVLACRNAKRIAAVFSYAGAIWADTSKCAPNDVVSLAELHGDNDPTVPYDGGPNTAYPQSPPYPPAAVTVSTWASRDGCTGPLADDGEAFDLVASLSGSETTVARAGGCPQGVDAELWTIHGGAHMDALNAAAFGQTVWGFLHGHPKP
jgi:polyhydroxybutyrate depolymerase